MLRNLAKFRFFQLIDGIEFQKISYDIILMTSSRLIYRKTLLK